jgi:ABC-2 type transport system ATP-binding protein
VALTARIDTGAGRQDASEAVTQGLAQLSRERIKVTAFALGQPSLDEVFLALTGHTAQDPAREGKVA